MAEPSQAVLRQMQRAALLKAGGYSWAEVGEQLNRAADTCKKWSQDYRETWHGLLSEACQTVLAEAEAEALERQRAILRGEEGAPLDLQQRAAHSVLVHASRIRPQRVEHGGEIGFTVAWPHRGGEGGGPGGGEEADDGDDA